MNNNGKTLKHEPPLQGCITQLHLIYFAMLISNTAAFYNQRTQYQKSKNITQVLGVKNENQGW